VALGLYQLRENETARRLQDLVPKYLPELPPDPYTGAPFHYRLSKGGEAIEFRATERIGDWQDRVLSPGQGILWSAGPDRVDHGGHKHGGVMLDDDPRWGEGFDLVTLVPHWRAVK
jgi:hypothetical protein